MFSPPPSPGAALASPIEISVFESRHYSAVRALWEATEGLGLSPADEHPAIEHFLQRNPGLSLVALRNERLAGAILVGHDGRRGVIHHLAVAKAERQRGLGRRLVREGLAGLKRAGIDKCHLLVFADNAAGQSFWTSVGAEHRDTLAIYSLATGDE